MSYRRVLIPVDGSTTSSKALAAAFDMISERSGRLRLLHVVDELTLVSGLEDPTQPMKAACEYGAQLLSEGVAMAEAAGVEADSQLVRVAGKRLGQVVAEEAAEWKADLIVVGTHGRRGLSRLLLGSGAEQVIRLAPIPVLVIRGTGD